MTSMLPKDPVSEEQETRETLCWRRHTPEFLCLRPEGHGEPVVADMLTTAHLGKEVSFRSNGGNEMVRGTLQAIKYFFQWGNQIGVELTISHRQWYVFTYTEVMIHG